MQDRRRGALIGLGIASWLLYLGITWLSGDFAYGIPGLQRPILEVFSLFGAVFACYLAALRIVLRGDEQKLWPVIVLFAVSFRVLVLFSEPIQEVDIYRYLWDGQVTAEGISPFRYSPEQVLECPAMSPPTEELALLVSLRDSSEVMQKILSRVHYRELPTVYPPVSQAVFALAALMTPRDAGLWTHLMVMKIWIVGFDLLTFAVLIGILRSTDRHVGWSLAYGWCPLVIKEFSNSGHLDAIAVFWTTLAIYAVVRGFRDPFTDKGRFTNYSSGFGWLAVAATLLGLGVGAKLYPVVLTPLLIAVTGKRHGWLRSGLIAGLFLVVSVMTCWPLLTRVPSEPQHEVNAAGPPVPALDQQSEGNPRAGLEAFFSRWKMNDFLFLIVNENLDPENEIPAERRPWFVVVPRSWRESLTFGVAARLGISTKRVPFLITRALAGGIFAILAIWLAVRAAKRGGAEDFLQSGFLTLAWFWLLLPTQNPWYWTWVLPLLPFARGRVWIAMSGLTLLYYLRFWFVYHFGESSVWFTSYRGADFFDYVVTWIEFGPWFLWLACERLSRRDNETGGLTLHRSPE